MSSLIKMIDAVLPPRCPFNGEIVDSQGAISPEAWKSLSFISAPYCDCCGFPFEFSVASAGEHPLCAVCLAQRPVFTKARAALLYNDASRDFILGFKHGDRTETVVAMVPWLRAAGAEFWADADVIVPVPLHRWRLLRRRYNQAALMGAAIARDVQKDFCADALQRVRHTPTQGHLRAGERQENVRRAFAVHPRKIARIAGKNIVLIDDVYTTGSTVSECAKALKDAGAAEVYVLCLARVGKPAKI